jgi:hypothetical protein
MTSLASSSGTVELLRVGERARLAAHLAPAVNHFHARVFVLHSESLMRYIGRCISDFRSAGGYARLDRVEYRLCAAAGGRAHGVICHAPRSISGISSVILHILVRIC